MTPPAIHYPDTIPRLIDFLQLVLTPSPGVHSMTLNVCPTRPNKIARPVDRRRHWLDIEAGDNIFVRGKRHRVTEVRVYRCSRPGECESVVRSGREWMLRSDPA